jgi:hypothetical protein
MASLVLDAPNAYLNIGNAREWRQHLSDCELSMWIRTRFRRRCCLVSLSNAYGEQFCIELNSTPGDSEDTSSGISARWVDVSNNISEGEVTVPPLADDRWHFIQVRSHCAEDASIITFIIDGTKLTTTYRHRARLGDFDNRYEDRPVYPSFDLIGARNCKGELRDFYIGKISDISVRYGPKFSEYLHWWTFDSPRGRTVWDKIAVLHRGLGTKQSEPLHLHACSCKWDVEDTPTPALYVSGREGLFATVPYLTACRVEQLLLGEEYAALIADRENAGTVGSSSSSSPGEITLMIPTEHKGNVSPLATPRGGFSLFPTVIPPSPDQRSMDHHASVNAGRLNALAVPRTPSLKPANPNGTKAPANASSQKLVIQCWLQTAQETTAVILSLPVPSGSIHIVANILGGRNIGLIYGRQAMIVQADLADDTWHEVKFSIDFVDGASIVVDGALASWESVDLNYDPDGQDVLPELTTETTVSHGGFLSWAEEEDLPKEDVELVRLLRQAFDPKGHVFGGAVQQFHKWWSTRDDNHSPIMDHVRDLFSSRRHMVIGSAFCGLLREVSVTIGTTTLEWVLNSGTGREVRPFKAKSHLNKKDLARDPTPKYWYSAYHDLTADVKPAGVSLRPERDAMMMSASMSYGSDKKRPTAPFLPELPAVVGPSPDADAMINNPHRTQSHLLKAAAILSIKGRASVWPKTKLPTCTCRFRDGQAATLQGVPIVLNETFELAIFACITSPEMDAPKGYGTMIAVHGVIRINVVPGRIVLLIVNSVGVDTDDRNDSATRSQNTPSFRSRSSSVASVSETASVTKLVANTHAFDDGKWHHLRVFIPAYSAAPRNDTAPFMLVDENPVELLPERRQRVARRRSSVLDTDSPDRRASLSGVPTPLQIFKERGGDDFGATPSATQQAAWAGCNIDIGFNLPSPAHADSSETEGDSILRTEYEALRCRLLASSGLESVRKRSQVRTVITLGGKRFCGSFARCKVTCSGFVPVEWSLTDGAGTRLVRFPITNVPLKPTRQGKVEDSPPSAGASLTAFPLTPGVDRTNSPGGDVNASFRQERSLSTDRARQPLHSELTVADPLWRPTHLPPMGLKLDGRRSYVEAIGLSDSIRPDILESFTLSFWFLDASRATTDSACLFSLHDRVNPSLDASAGIFIHTAINTATSPKTRLARPHTTSFILCDSSERFLVLETDFDFLDGLWHKIEWRVTKASENKAIVVVDDREIPVRRPCAEFPSRFQASDFVMNVGARDEGDSGVVLATPGELRGIVIAADGKDMLRWDLDEGHGNVAADKMEMVIGQIHFPHWEITSFPPLTPTFEFLSSLEVSPVSDIAATLNHGDGLVVNITIKSDTDDVGTLFTIVDYDRRPALSFIVNEARNRGRTLREPGTHRLVVTRATDGTQELTHELQLVALDLFDGLWHELEVRIPSNFDDASNTTITVSIDHVPRPLLLVQRAGVLKQKQLKTSEGLGRAPSMACLTRGMSGIGGDRHSPPSSPKARIDALMAAPDLRGALARSSSYGALSESDKSPSDFSFSAFVLGRCTDTDGLSGSMKNLTITEIGHHHPLVFIALTESAACVSELHRDIAVTNLQWSLTVPPPSCIALGPSRFVTFGTLRTLRLSAFRFRCEVLLPQAEEWIGGPPPPQCIARYGCSNGTEFRAMLHEDHVGKPAPACLAVRLNDEDDAVFEFNVDLEAAFDGQWHALEIVVHDSERNQGSILLDGQELGVRYGDCAGPKTFVHEGATGSLGALCIDGVSATASLTALMMCVTICDTVPDPEVHAKWDMRTGYGNILRDTSGKRRHAVARNPLWRSMIAGEPAATLTDRVVVRKVAPRKHRPASPAKDPLRLKSPTHEHLSGSPRPSIVAAIGAMGIAQQPHSSAAERRRDTLTFRQVEARQARRDSQMPKGLSHSSDKYRMDDDLGGLSPETASIASLDDGGGYIPRDAFDLLPDATLFVTRWGNNPSLECEIDEDTSLVLMPQWPSDGWLSGSVQCPQALHVQLMRPSTVFLLAFILPRGGRCTIDVNFARGMVRDRMPTPASDGGFVEDAGSVVRRCVLTPSTSRLVVLRFPEPYAYVRTVSVCFVESEVPPALESLQIFGVPNTFDVRKRHSVMPVGSVTPVPDITPQATIIATAAAARGLGLPMWEGDTSGLVPMLTPNASKSKLEAVATARRRFGQIEEEEVIAIFNQVDAERRGYTLREELVRHLQRMLPPDLLTEKDVDRQLILAGAPPSVRHIGLDRFRILMARLTRL